jgi:hypothetical protein
VVLERLQAVLLVLAVAWLKVRVAEVAVEDTSPLEATEVTFQTPLVVLVEQAVLAEAVEAAEAVLTQAVLVE